MRKISMDKYNVWMNNRRLFPPTNMACIGASLIIVVQNNATLIQGYFVNGCVGERVINFIWVFCSVSMQKYYPDTQKIGCTI